VFRVKRAGTLYSLVKDADIVILGKWRAGAREAGCRGGGGERGTWARKEWSETVRAREEGGKEGNDSRPDNARARWRSRGQEEQTD